MAIFMNGLILTIGGVASKRSVSAAFIPLSYTSTKFDQILLIFKYDLSNNAVFAVWLTQPEISCMQT